MAFVLRKPVLVGGLGLTIGLSVLELFHPATSHVGGSIVWGAIALGSGVWWLKQRSFQPIDFAAAPPPDRTAVEKSFGIVERLINQLATEAGANSSTVEGLRQQLTALTKEIDRTQARLSILGGKSVGKTSLSQLIAGQKATPSEDSTSSVNESVSTDANTADLVLFVTTGDLTDSEFQRIQELVADKHRVLLIFNKQDQYLPEERPLVLQNLRWKVKEWLAEEDVMAIATQPAPVKVRQHQADGSVVERLEQPEPDASALKERLQTILSQDGSQLILSAVHRRSLALKKTVVQELNRVRRDRALPLIEQSQWIAGAATFANPVSSLDLLATATVTAQLVIDLGAIYQHQFSLDQAKAVAGTIAEQMIKLGLVEMASQAIAPLLKSNALTYVAGGLLQGVSAAYLTRLAGLSLVEYFEEQSFVLEPGTESTFGIDRLVQKLKSVFQANQRTAFWQGLVKQGIDRLIPQGTLSGMPRPAES